MFGRKERSVGSFFGQQVGESKESNLESARKIAPVLAQLQSLSIAASTAVIDSSESDYQPARALVVGAYPDEQAQRAVLENCARTTQLGLTSWKLGVEDLKEIAPSPPPVKLKTAEDQYAFALRYPSQLFLNAVQMQLLDDNSYRDNCMAWAVEDTLTAGMIIASRLGLSQSVSWSDI